MGLGQNCNVASDHFGKRQLRWRTFEFEQHRHLILLLNIEGFMFAYMIFKLLILTVPGEGDVPKHRIA